MFYKRFLTKLLATLGLLSKSTRVQNPSDFLLFSLIIYFIYFLHFIYLFFTITVTPNPLSILEFDWVDFDFVPYTVSISNFNRLY